MRFTPGGGRCAPAVSSPRNAGRVVAAMSSSTARGHAGPSQHRAAIGVRRDISAWRSATRRASSSAPATTARIGQGRRAEMSSAQHQQGHREHGRRQQRDHQRYHRRIPKVRCHDGAVGSARRRGVRANIVECRGHRSRSRHEVSPAGVVGSARPALCSPATGPCRSHQLGPRPARPEPRTLPSVNSAARCSPAARRSEGPR